MTKPQSTAKSDPQSKINEAEVCFTMGLFDEALSLYEQVLQEFSDLSAEQKSEVEAKVMSIRGDLAEREKDEAGSVSTEEISMLKKSLSGQEDAPAILDSASAFKDLGLFEEALAEFEKLLLLDYPPEKVVPEIADCFFKLYSVNDLFGKAMKCAGDQRISAEKRGRLKFLFGEEMERRENRDLAIDLYEEAEKDLPDDKDVSKRLELLRSRLSSGSKYDYLLRQKILNTEQ